MLFFFVMNTPEKQATLACMVRDPDTNLFAGGIFHLPAIVHRLSYDARKILAKTIQVMFHTALSNGFIISKWNPDAFVAVVEALSPCGTKVDALRVFIVEKSTFVALKERLPALKTLTRFDHPRRAKETTADVTLFQFSMASLLHYVFFPSSTVDFHSDVVQSAIRMEDVVTARNVLYPLLASSEGNEMSQNSKLLLYKVVYDFLCKSTIDDAPKAPVTPPPIQDQDCVLRSDIGNATSF